MTYERTPIFTYGTLRYGGALHNWLKGSTYLGTGTLTGYLLAEQECGAYPVAVRSDHPSLSENDHRPDVTALRPGIACRTVIGEVYGVRRDLLADLTAMELRAGYDATWQRIRMENYHGSTSYVDALAFTWTRDKFGPLVPTGDWFDVEPADWPTNNHKENA